MPPSTLDVRTEGDLTVVEAPTAEQALGEVATRVGPHAQIVAVEKVLRGGMGGFFARELVQIKAKGGPAAPTAEPAAPGRPPTAEPGNAVQRMLAKLSDETGEEEKTFAETLRSQMGLPQRESVRPRDLPLTSDGRPLDAEQRPTQAESPQQPPAPEPAPPAQPAPAQVAPAQVAPAQVAPVQAAPAPQGPAPARPPDSQEAEARDAVLRNLAARASRAEPLGQVVVPAQRTAVGSSPVQWSVENLVRRGMPALIVDAVSDLDPRDDLGWVHAIGRAVGTLCRPLPAGDEVLVGPRARNLADALDIPCVRPPTGRGRKGDRSSVPRSGSFCAPLSGTENNRSWVGWARAGRWLHLVAGGKGWRDLLFDEPLAVSWADENALPEAIALCADLGLVLGYGPVNGRDGVRACPVDVAMAVRAMMPAS